MKAFRYVLEIDEEGFPLFDGLRVDDLEFVRNLFENFYRLDPQNLNSALLTKCEGESVLVAPFESPLVAQSVSDLNEEESIWEFPGQWRQKVSHSEIRVDAWNRLRTRLGPLKINATLSRKAQVQFGEAWARLKSPMEFPQWYFKAPEKKVSDALFWEEAYQQNKDGWEMHDATPVLKSEFAKWNQMYPLNGESCVVVGAGRGHEAHYLSQNSQMNVVALDFAESAEKEFHKIYPNSRARFVRADAFEYLAREEGAHGMVMEHTFFCAIDPALRSLYFRNISHALKEGGLLMGIFWMRPSFEGPPFGFSQWELRETLKNFPFEILEWKLSSESHESRMGQEYFVVLKKRNSLQ